MVVKIVGITKYEKNGKKNFTLHYIQEFSEREQEGGAVGVKVSTVWTQLPVAEIARVNDLVELRFEPGFNNTATLSDIIRFSASEKHYLNHFAVPDIYTTVPGIPDKETTSAETATTAKSGK